MSTGTKIGLGIAAFIVLAAGCGIGSYNGLAEGEQECDAEWAQVQNGYQRRNDLVPNIVATCKGYMAHEDKVLIEVAKAQASVGKVTIDPKNVTEAELEKWSQAQAGLGGALQKLMMVTFSQPNLKADKGMEDLRTTLEGCENRISVSRRNFNETVKAQNQRIVRFPNNIIFSSFKKRSFFQAETGAQSAPKIDFGK